MKRAALLLVAVLLLTFAVPQLASAGVTFDLGLKGGVAIANILETWNGEKFPTTSPVIGPVVGGFAAFNLNKVLTLQPEVYFLTQGGIWEETNLDLTQKWKHVYKYVHVPVLAKVHLIPDGKMVPILFVGPSVDFLLSANRKYWEDGVLVEEGDYDSKKTNFCVVFGGGVEFKMEKITLVLDVRYDLGLTNILGGDAEENWSLKTRALMFLAGIGF